MSFFGHKRARTQKSSELRASSTWWDELLRVLTDRSVVARIIFCLMAAMATAVAVNSWETPFPYRLGQRFSEGILAQIDFQRINSSATRRDKEQAADDVPFIYTSISPSDPQPLRELPSKLRAQLREIVDAGSLQEVQSTTQTAFRLVIPDATPQSQQETASGQIAESYQLLKNAAATPEKLDILVSEFQEFLLPLESSGLLLEGLPEDQAGPSDRITIILSDGEEHVGKVAKIELGALLASGGALKATWKNYPALVPLQETLDHWIKSQPPDALRVIEYDPKLTREAKQERREETADVFDPYHAGDILVQAGDVFDEEHLELLQTEYAALDAQATWIDRGIRIGTVISMILVLGALNGYYLIKNEPGLVQSYSRLGIYLLLAVATVAVARFLSFDPWRMQIVPLLAAVMILAIAYNQVLAILTAFSLGLIVTLATGASIDQFVVFISVCAVSVILLPSVNSRSTLIIVGLWAGITYFAVTVGAGILGSQLIDAPWMNENLWWDGLRGFAWCLVAGFLVAGSLPFIESVFGIVTNISLLELSDISHPLLQELVRRAPGTYNHSISVATIGETAAERIGANGRLLRVGAYFHDVGKMLKPQYFIENITQGSENRHDHLAPAMSTLIIIGHVKDGVDLARQHNLPKSLIDFIEQHHGTTLVEYFYHEATKQAGLQPDHKTDAEESSFRYPGPKPQSRELGVMMLADAVESASRTLREPTPARIESLVHEITLKRLLDGQFEESGLTLTEIHTVEESLVKSLTAIYHGRIKYPEQKTA